MFSNNNQISARQVFRLFVFDFVGESTLVLPAMLSAYAGNGGIFSIILGGVLASIYLWYLTKVQKGMDSDLAAYLERSVPVPVAKLMFAFLTFHFIVMAGYGAYMFSSVMKKGLIPEESYTLILGLVMLIAGYAVSGGIESRARIYEILFTVLFIMLLIMLLVALRNVDVQYISGFFQTSPHGIVKGSLPVFLCLMPVFLVLFFPAYVEKKRWGMMMRVTFYALWFAVGVIAAVYLILIGNFGADSLAKMQYPAITLMSSIHLKGSFLKRLDAFMIGIWFFTLFALLNVFLFYGHDTLQHLLTSGGRTKKPRIWLLVTAVLTAVAAELFYYTEFESFFTAYICYVATPLLVVLPAAILILGKGKKSCAENRN